jgi:hypothetical protein
VKSNKHTPAKLTAFFSYEKTQEPKDTITKADILEKFIELALVKA